MWRSAANRLPGESSILARCRTDSAACSPAATRFLAIIDRAAEQNGWIRIAEINRAINLDIRPVSNVAQYGAAPLWPTPLMTFAVNAGDCKDYAVAKFVALRELGFSADDLRIIIVHIRGSAEYHALTAVRYDSHWFVLDNRTSTIKRDNDVAEYEPMFVVDGANVRRMQPPPPAQASAVNAKPSAADVTLVAGPESLPAFA
jgi:predicted transglutaminase-like cysteine proteinase